MSKFHVVVHLEILDEDLGVAESFRCAEDLIAAHHLMAKDDLAAEEVEPIDLEVSLRT